MSAVAVVTLVYMLFGVEVITRERGVLTQGQQETKCFVVHHIKKLHKFICNSTKDIFLF